MQRAKRQMQSRSRECKIIGSSNNAGGTLFMKDSKYNKHLNMEQIQKGKNNRTVSSDSRLQCSCCLYREVHHSTENKT